MMVGEELTGEQVFLRCMLPCADLRLARGKIDGECFIKLIELVEKNGKPGHILLRRCFPIPACELRNHAKDKVLDRWAPATVKDFLLNHHGKGNCRMLRCKIIAGDNRRIMVSFEGRQFEAFNLPPYGYSLKEGDIVYTHKRVVVLPGE